MMVSIIVFAARLGECQKKMEVCAFKWNPTDAKPYYQNRQRSWGNVLGANLINAGREERRHEGCCYGPIPNAQIVEIDVCRYDKAPHQATRSINDL